MSETAIMRDILIALPGPPAGVWWRQNVGVGRTESGAVMRFGVPGTADIVGCYCGRHVEIEVKTATGRQSKQQRHREAAITRAGGIYIVARSPEQALAALEAAL